MIGMNGYPGYQMQTAYPQTYRPTYQPPQPMQAMKNSDGSKGEHFKKEQAEQMRKAHCPDCDECEFWAAMNMMYSDYCEVAKKLNVDRPDFYAHMAKAFLKDEDAGEDKLAKYMKYIAKK